MMVKMDGDKLVETWQICAGWAEEFCINTWDHKNGLDQPAIRVFVKSENKGYDSRTEEQNFPGFVSEPFKMRPICNYHINNGDFPHPSGNSFPVTKDTWELLIKMCGYMVEEEGDNIHFIGRLASYKYFNMDQAIKNSLDYYKEHF